jgi:hypothetical protein
MIGLALTLLLSSTPPPAAVTFSASVCSRAELRVLAMERIAKEKRLSKIGGVLDTARVAYWQRVVGAIDDHREDTVAGLRSMDASLLPCSDELVASVARCIEVGDGRDGVVISHWANNEACRSPEMEPYRKAYGAQ